MGPFVFAGLQLFPNNKVNLFLVPSICETKPAITILTCSSALGNYNDDSCQILIKTKVIKHI